MCLSCACLRCACVRFTCVPHACVPQARQCLHRWWNFSSYLLQMCALYCVSAIFKNTEHHLNQRCEQTLHLQDAQTVNTRLSALSRKQKHHSSGEAGGPAHSQPGGPGSGSSSHVASPATAGHLLQRNEIVPANACA